ncbi:hypothetical protein ScPMuIL_012770 [Solemya velum]
MLYSPQYFPPIFYIIVVIEWSPESKDLILGQEVYKITCSKTTSFNQLSMQISINDRVIPAKPISGGDLRETWHDVNIDVIDVRGINGTESLRADSCAAVNAHNSSYSILRGG